MTLPSPFDIVRIRVPCQRDIPVWLYKPSSWGDVGPMTFSVPVYAEHIPPAVASVIVMTNRNERRMHGYAKTRLRPEIMLDDPDEHYKALCRLDARNKPWDSIFENRNLVAHCRLMLLPDVPAASSFRERWPNATHSLRLVKVSMRDGDGPDARLGFAP